MNNKILEIIEQAAHIQAVLRIIYIEKDGTSEGWRYIEPYSIGGEGEGEALFAWDIKKDGIRRFILNRINQAELSLEHFNPRYPIEIA